MKGQPRVVLAGIIARMPFAGVAWQFLHFLEGLRRLGCDVHYLEDTGVWPYDADRETVTDDCGYSLRYLQRLMSWCGMDGRWTYRSGVDGSLHGPGAASLGDTLRGADALLNVTGATILREEHLRVPVRVFIETDPVLPQIEVAQGNRFTIELLEAHTHHFTYGENIGKPVCPLPTGPFAYRPTRQPVILDWWMPTGSLANGCTRPFTTVTHWKQTCKDIEWEGELYTWSKHAEFLKVADLPRRAGRPFELALAHDEADPVALLREKGWQVTEALPISRDILPYRDYIRSARGEFTVAKDQNIRLHSGWFSDRSATFLAAGRPVITQDTGFEENLPTGEGLFSFQDMDDILAAIDEIDSDYERHCRAAREIAETHFRAETVLRALLRQAGL
jgi:hypothetical protein